MARVELNCARTNDVVARHWGPHLRIRHSHRRCQGLYSGAVANNGMPRAKSNRSRPLGRESCSTAIAISPLQRSSPDSGCWPVPIVTECVMTNDPISRRPIQTKMRPAAVCGSSWRAVEDRGDTDRGSGIRRCDGGRGRLALAPDGHLLSASSSVLATTPFADFRVPGVLLAVFVGVGGLFTAALTWRNWHLRRGHQRRLCGAGFEFRAGRVLADRVAAAAGVRRHPRDRDACSHRHPAPFGRHVASLARLCTRKKPRAVVVQGLTPETAGRTRLAIAAALRTQRLRVPRDSGNRLVDKRIARRVVHRRNERRKMLRAIPILSAMSLRASTPPPPLPQPISRQDRRAAARKRSAVLLSGSNSRLRVSSHAAARSRGAARRHRQRVRRVGAAAKLPTTTAPPSRTTRRASMSARTGSATCEIANARWLRRRMSSDRTAATADPPQPRRCRCARMCPTMSAAPSTAVAPHARRHRSPRRYRRCADPTRHRENPRAPLARDVCTRDGPLAPPLRTRERRGRILGRGSL